jgi:uncharacterized membrane protein
MWEEIKILIANFFEEYPKRKLGFIGGVIVGAIIWEFGFFPTLFAFFCGVIGLYIGSRFDEGDDLIDSTLKSIDKNLPEKFRQWKFKW